MENNIVYRQIVKVALILIGVLSIVVGIIGQDLAFALSLVYGGALGVGGFLWIVVMTSKIDGNTNAQKLVIVHYILRYLLYAGMLILGLCINLNIFSMLLGFVCINLSIKYNVYKNGKEED